MLLHWLRMLRTSRFFPRKNEVNSRKDIYTVYSNTPTGCGKLFREGEHLISLQTRKKCLGKVSFRSLLRVNQVKQRDEKIKILNMQNMQIKSLSLQKCGIYHYVRFQVFIALCIKIACASQKVKKIFEIFLCKFGHGCSNHSFCFKADRFFFSKTIFSSFLAKAFEGEKFHGNVSVSQQTTGPQIFLLHLYEFMITVKAIKTD